MKNIHKGMIVAGSALAVFASLFPLTSYAESKEQKITVSVSPYIEISATSGANIEDVMPNTIGKGTFSATVTANKGYKLSLSAKTNSSLTSTESSDVIPAIANGGSSTLPSGISAWGVRKQGATDGTYTGLTLSPEVFYTSTTGGSNLTTEFNVGIQVAPSVASGTYSTDVTITASTD